MKYIVTSKRIEFIKCDGYFIRMPFDLIKGGSPSRGKCLLTEEGRAVMHLVLEGHNKKFGVFESVLGRNIFSNLHYRRSEALLDFLRSQEFNNPVSKSIIEDTAKILSGLASDVKYGICTDEEQEFWKSRLSGIVSKKVIIAANFNTSAGDMPGNSSGVLKDQGNDTRGGLVVSGVTKPISPEA